MATALGIYCKIQSGTQGLPWEKEGAVALAMLLSQLLGTLLPPGLPLLLHRFWGGWGLLWLKIVW